MVKPTLRFQAPLAFCLLAGLVACSHGCSTARRGIPATHELPFAGASKPPLSAKQLWQHQVEGKLTDLSVSSLSGHVLVTQVLEAQGPHSTQLSLRDRTGKKLWNLNLNSPVRSQWISSSAEWILVATYNDELIRIDPKNGTQLWILPESGMCRPVVLEKNRQILCHHDDDSLPGVAFTVLSLNGKVKQRFQIPQDLLVLKISADESRIALGMVKGRIWILDPTFKKIADRRVDGEIVDLSLASGPQPAGAEWSALVNVNGLGQQLIAMNPSGKLRWQQTLEAPHQQIELSEDGSLTAIYGNGPKGQLVSLLGTPAFGEGRLTLLWSYRAPRYADYNQRIDFSGEDIVLGFEEVTERTRHSHVVALQRSGQLNWDIPIQSEEGAYLYARGMTSKSGLLVLGTDDGRLTAYEVQR